MAPTGPSISWYEGYTDNEVAEIGADFARDVLEKPYLIRTFRSAAICARYTDDIDPETAITAVLAANEDLSVEDEVVLREEHTNRWRQPKKMYGVAIICSLSAAVLGMDETVINGAMGFFKHQFNIGSNDLLTTTKLGALCAAPYICCALFACWITQPLNKLLGRRGTIIAVSVFSLAACLGSAFANNAWSLGIARVFLGLGIGPNSATTPMFAAECSPPRIRGALVMQWQVWTAFGIMLGYASSMAFFQVPDISTQFPGTNWRIMLASAGLPALIVILFTHLVPESPRWYLTKGKYAQAWDAITQLRRTNLQAARDLFQAHQSILMEKQMQLADPRRAKFWARFRSLFSERRNRRAFVASEICMFLQQFSGVNIIAYYSSEIFLEAKMPHMVALATSLGFGAINFAFALPAFFTIDRFGRRPLLLCTIPFMVITLIATAFCFLVPEGTGRIAAIATSIYFFGMAYSSGAGPVPFTYSAEAYPLHIRPLGMSFATATAWFFNAMLALTWPPLMNAITPLGAFMFYATTNVVAFVLVLLLVPETKNKTLEELDNVFDVPTTQLMHDGWSQLLRSFKLKRGEPKSIMVMVQPQQKDAPTNGQKDTSETIREVVSPELSGVVTHGSTDKQTGGQSEYSSDTLAGDSNGDSISS